MGKKKNDRARDKKRQKHQRRRAEAKKEARARALPQSTAALVELAAAGEFGPAWISASYDDPDDPTALVRTLLTRRVRGRLVAAVTLVDRTCLGAKDTFVLGPASHDELLEFLEEELAVPDEEFISCKPELVQSIVFHAIDFARTLGFEPSAGFPAAMFEPRPDPLLPTPNARPDRPLYIAGPQDDVVAILNRLRASVGIDNFDFIMPDEDALRDLFDEAIARGMDLSPLSPAFDPVDAEFVDDTP